MPSDEESPPNNEFPSDEELSLRAYLLSIDYSNFEKCENEFDILRCEYEELLCRFEIEMYMHLLSAGYYHNRAFWFTFLPLLLVTTSVSICGFVNTGEYDDSLVFNGNLTNVNQTTAMSQDTANDTDSGVSQETLSLIIGFLGVLSTFLAALGKHLNYESKGDMHASAATTLTSVLEQILFEFMAFKKEGRLVGTATADSSNNDEGNSSNAGEGNPSNTNAANSTGAKNVSDYRVELEKHQSKFEIMDKSCTVPIPNDILHAFLTLRGIRDCIEPPMFKNKICRRFANDLFREFQKKGFFCRYGCYPPSVNVEIMFEKEFKLEVKAKLARCGVRGG